MNSDEIRYFRDLIGYCSVMIVAVVLVTAAFVVVPDNTPLALVLYVMGAIGGSYAWGLFKDGWIRQLWNRVSEYSHEPILEREEALLDGEEL